MKKMQRQFCFLTLIILFGILISAGYGQSPSYPESRVRALVARAKTDMRALALGIETYYIETNQGYASYPPVYPPIGPRLHYQSMQNIWQEFRTPGNGTTYTLPSLTVIADGALETTTTGHVLRDRIVISPNDSLSLSNETLFIANRWSTGTMQNTVSHYPSLIISGRLKADNVIFNALPPSGDHSTSGGAVFVTGKQGGLAEATFTSCTFLNPVFAAIASSTSSVQMANCRVENSVMGVNAIAGSNLTMEHCILQKTTAGSFEGQINFSNCSLDFTGVLLSGSSHGSRLSDCSIDGKWASGQDAPAMAGVSLLNVDTASIERCTIRNFPRGILCWNTSNTVTLVDNVLQDNTDGAMTFGYQANPTLRRNIIERNAVEQLILGQNTVTLAAVTILFDAKPDFGTLNNPGENIFRNNGPVTFYNATTSTIHAQGNIWEDCASVSDVEEIIYHQPDDAQDSDISEFVSGQVLFEPFRNSARVKKALWEQY